MALIAGKRPDGRNDFVYSLKHIHAPELLDNNMVWYLVPLPPVKRRVVTKLWVYRDIAEDNEGELWCFRRRSQKPDMTVGFGICLGAIEGSEQTTEEDVT